MGGNISGCAAVDTNGGKLRAESRLDDIPEGCAALVLTHFDPLDICKLARLNKVFWDASKADFIWESKLPSNYQYIVQKVFGDDALAYLGKKDIYAKLCRPNYFAKGTKIVWLDKKTGDVCLSVSAKAMKITGIDDRRYWNLIPTEESRYKTVAYLQQTWWLEVKGELEFQLPAGKYSLFFRLQLGRSSKRRGRRICSLEHIRGWDIKPVEFQLSTADGQRSISKFYLENPGNWTCYHVGDFVVENSGSLTKIKFSLTQIDCTHTKAGLCVDSVLVFPSRIVDNLDTICRK